MNKKGSVLGIDLGTSSVKVLQRYADGSLVKAKASYTEISPEAWWEAVRKALSELNMEDVTAIGLSSQVGTYLVDDTQVIAWNDNAGAEELGVILDTYDTVEFCEEISMPHPQIVSYPIPRLCYIQKRFPNAKKIGQPKDFLCEKLTGNFVTDPYSWRGLANLETKIYSKKFLQVTGVKEEQLPHMIDYADLAGYTKEISLSEQILPAGIPVYVGLNDYFASLIGMGVQHAGEMFDITGTSEHLGIVEDVCRKNTDLVSGPYLFEHVHYGVTASSGASLRFGMQFCESELLDVTEIRKHNPPIFLPYLQGERAPIWDGNARGMFFGMEADCTREELAYAVMEGVVFSLYHIYESMGCPQATVCRVSGGAAVNRTLNKLKAEMFCVPVAVLKENDTSALGAVMVAEVGVGNYADMEQAMTDIGSVKEVITPTGQERAWLQQRFEIYKELYPAVKVQYEQLRRITR